VTQDHVVAERENITLTDTITYENLVPGKEYTVTGTLMDKVTGEKLLDENGKEITASKTFKATEVTGSIDIEFTFNSVVLENKKTIVAFEDLYYEGINVATHADINDENQTVKYPEIHTTFIDKTTNDKFVNVSETETLIDTVSYSNLVIGKEYTVTGTVMVKETGESLKDSEGNIITGSTTFVPTTEDGTVDVVFTIDTTKLKGKTLVCFEKLYLGNNLVRVHEDINDVYQTVHVPDIKTTLVDKATDDHIVAESGTITLTDTVSYSNLVPGKTYEMTGTLMVKETGEALKDSEGNPITASTEFTPESANGTVDVVFTFDGALLGDSITLVAFEDLKYKALTYTTHSDINDESQTVNFPNLKTTFIDEATNNQLVSRNSAAKLTDTVTYENLVPGKEYTVTGTIMVKETGEALKDSEGNVITASKTFTPSEEDGSINITFTVDTTNLENKTLVAFEVISFNGKIIKTHEDINDLYQTIYVPEIKTTLVDKNTRTDVVTYADSVTLVDTVSYSNLVVGKEYTVSGKLMDKNSNTELLDSEGNPITASTKFTSTTVSGTVDVEFVINSTILTGKTLVAFETLTYNGVEITIHADINDVDQAVNIPLISSCFTDRITSSKNVSFGEEISLIDKVEYQNLIPGMQYKLVGSIYSYNSNGIIKESIESVIFCPDKSNGSIEMPFILDTTEYIGDTLVAFEELYFKDILIASHKDIYDDKQTVYSPELSTNAMDSCTKSKYANALDEITITDYVSYKNLIPGRTYGLVGKIVYIDSGEDITGAVSNVQFMPEDTNGTIAVDFRFNNQDLSGLTVVVTEQLYLNDTLLCEHNDLNDFNQTVYFPSIITSANVNDLKEFSPKESITLIDEIEYTNLEIGFTYVIVGQLMNDDGTEFKINDETVTSETSFIPLTENGTAQVVFNFCGSNLTNGKNIVCYEDLYREGLYSGDGITISRIHVTEHRDINNKNQTVTVKVRPAITKTGEGINYIRIGEIICIFGIDLCFITLISRRRKSEASQDNLFEN
ncbi:MAG: VaFE repeat-containing surface-anchored protein, partial [Clostridia bacterium]|nr:VaFE repeat-containing surface-anchored protein [Clostridia bacterium]